MDSHPKFTALSYVWGPYCEPRDTVMCNGISIEITANCKKALSALRKLPGPVTVWVDAICINQQDDDEKAKQLPLMEEIYAWSQTVYVWLGPGSESSDRAMDWLRKASTISICLMPVCFSQFFTGWQYVLGLSSYWLKFINLYTPWRIIGECMRASAYSLVDRNYIVTARTHTSSKELPRADSSPIQLRGHWLPSEQRIFRPHVDFPGGDSGTTTVHTLRREITRLGQLPTGHGLHTPG